MFDKISKIKKLFAKSKSIVVLAFLAGLATSFGVGYKGGTEAIQSGPDTLTTVVRDTVVFTNTEIIHAPAIIDTLKIPIEVTVFDTLYVEQEVAYLDTTFEEGCLQVIYVPVYKWFDVYWEPNPVEIVYRDVVQRFEIKVQDDKFWKLRLGSGYSSTESAWLGLGLSIGKNSIQWEQSLAGWRLGYYRDIYGWGIKD
tara:strand:- start:2805 stop:3395 length:591 start_codon:yes stop_codon:yes gene_type:complete